MDSLISRDKSEAKKKGIYAVAAWGGTGLLLATAGPGVLVVAGAAGAGYLTWKWFAFRAKRGMRF
jgi:4-amino-4-deoxy-L-arabinose transferase-like glycosyltransferase